MTETVKFERARFVLKTGGRQKEIKVHFNPMTLQYTVTNTMSRGRGDKTKQYVSQTTGKLTMELIFDTTNSGEDVRAYSDEIARFMYPVGKEKIPPIVLFEWGKYTFQGMADTYKETLDFFAPNGVPLRASINLTLSRQDKVFSQSGKGEFSTEPLDVPGSSAADVVDLATRAGDPRAARGIAESNNLDSLRMSAGISLSVGASVEVGGLLDFSAGFGMGAGAGASASFGSSASAGVSASAGAFGGLRSTDPNTRSIQLDLDALAPRSQVAELSTDNAASFDLGGKASIQSSSSLIAKVDGPSGSEVRLQFDD